MRRAIYFTLSAVGAFTLLRSLWQPAPISSQPAPLPVISAQFRIIVGLTDRVPRLWQGAVTSPDLASVGGWRTSGEDRVESNGKFEFRTKIGPLENQVAGDGNTDWDDPRIRRLIPQGLVVRVRAAGSSRVSFTSEAGAFEFAAGDLPMGKVMPVLGGNGSVEQLPLEEKLSEAGSADDYPAVAVTPNGTRWTAWLSYKDGADRVLARGGGQLHELTGRGDHQAPALASDSAGRIFAVWSRNDGGTFHLYARVLDNGSWTAETKLTSAGGSNLWPRLASDGHGKVALAWQGFRANQSVVLARLWDGKRWSAERRMSEGASNSWMPSAAFGGGKLWIAWDSYATGSYQIYAREWDGAPVRVTRGSNFSVRASVAADTTGKPVIAWEESGAAWGKDYGYLSDRRGTALYNTRRIRAAVLNGTDWAELVTPVADAAPAGIRKYIQQPQIAFDGAGRLYLSFRARTSASTARIDGWASQGRWETFLTRLEGSRWLAARPRPSSVGRNGMRAALAAAGNRVHLAWPADNRLWPAVKYGEIGVYAAGFPVEGAAARLDSAPLASGAPPVSAHPNEDADTKRIREYRVSISGKEYRIVRGDLHRHTELSQDGAGDGSLDDLYRYALDAAAMDYAHVADHQMGSDEEYNWWLTQKSNDMYHMPGRFVPLYGYERSVPYPNGHRNVIWAERGKPVLRIRPEEQKGAADTGPILYPYLRDTKGIATSHTSATQQGTDWRDNDAALEPLVEIYQGFESNYEHPGAPRAWKEGESKVHQGVRPSGYVWNAWAKGYKLGVQSSSDHVSTHMSYACILVENFTRQGLVDAMRRRHAYAATDSIVLDARITAGPAVGMMGDVIDASAAPALKVKVLGTASIRQIDVIRNNQYIHKLNPGARDAAFEYVDNTSGPGESYYYVRVEQTDGQLAWSSPIWVRRAK